MTKKRIKKLLFPLFAGSLSIFCVAGLISCKPTKERDPEEMRKELFVKRVHNSAIDYDFGLATDPINNLNYVRYKSVDKVLPSLVDSFIKNGPNNALKRLISTNQFAMTVVDTSKSLDEKKEPSPLFDDFWKNKNDLAANDGYGLVTGQYYELTNFNLVGGLGKPSSLSDVTKTSTIYTFRNPKNSGNYMAITGFINNKLNRWSNGDYINAQDIRDYLEYILDINTGSQKLDEILKYGIRGAEKFINTQKEYLAKYNRNYINPWGRRKYILDTNGNYIQDPKQQVWQPQIKDASGKFIDAEDVKKIKEAALSFGFYTGQLFLDYENEFIESNLTNNPEFKLDKDIQEFIIKDQNGTKKKINLVKNPYINPYQEFKVQNNKIITTYNQISNSENGFTMIFDQNKTPNLVFLISNIITNLYPINRKYVETVAGGIDKYGSDPKLFLTSGPFTLDPKEIVLGPQGELVLHKNNEYFDANNTVSNKIKIYFSADRNINTTFFEDGYISQTFIPATKIIRYWSDKEYKDYLNKNSGFGTIAYGFNLDNETNGDSYLQDPDLRNAIYYSINRETIIKFVGWDFSFPVNTFTSYGQYKTQNGKNIETFFTDLKSTTKNNKTFPIQNYDFVVHIAKSFTFEKTRRTDFAYDIETARFYLDRFKKKHPNLKNISLRFLNNSTDEQKNAGLFLRESLKIAFGDYINLELKSLPENTFVSFIEEGKYDIIYQNYDKIGGNGADDYVSTFFKDDGIDSLSQKTIGFKNNPVGSYTYSDYIIGLLLEKQNLLFNLQSFENLLKNEIKKIKDVILTSYKNDFNAANTALKINEFVKKHVPELVKKFNNKIYNTHFVSLIIEYLLTNTQNIKYSRVKEAYKNYISTIYTIDQIAEMTKDTKSRLRIQESIQSNGSKFDFWKKFIEISFIKNNETLTEYTDRLSSFFSSNFTTEELKQGWKEESIYVFIGELEKIIRDGAFLVPLMEVDTNWEITRVGGVDSLFRFSLQYAYDYTKPPRPGLPRGKEN
ncbi:ABC transporter substrate-binding protein [Mycoplasmopsis cynos]|uniref:ABC transporter substrate-binding protein n=1 Tax=Mycoplasmopsis cynos TaxID=171284 RepID=UPI002AFED911|nr:ABC transporter substrate-binding protein [Mycoplasmopsis cynos]WQQ17180.1 ABC transporter substrate-binding protein [Mycoplasmopsis cynos]